MDSRDYRKTWNALKESWAKEDVEVNVSATKKEKLEEGKRKIPDSFKAHQFKKKGAEAEAPEKDEKDDKPEDKKDDTKGKTIFGKKATEGKKLPKTGMTPGKTLFGKKKATEDAAPGSAGGATTSVAAGDTGAGDVGEDGSTNGPAGIARYADRLGCKPGQKCKVKPQERTFPGRTVTGESAGKRMFSHFRKFLEVEGFPLEQDPTAVAAVAAGVPEVSPEVPPEAGTEPGLDDVGQEGPPDSDLLADLQAKFPGAKITVTIEAGEVPFDAQTIEKAQEVAATVPAGDELEDIGGEEDLGAEGIPGVPGAEAPVMGGEEIPVAQEESAMSELDIIAQEAADYVAGLGGQANGQVISQFVLKHHPEAIDQIEMIAQAVKEKLAGIGESVVMGEEGEDEVKADVPEMEVGGEVGAEGGEGGEMGDAGLGGLEAGAEDVAAEISSDSIALSPEQWEAFLAGGTEEVPPVAVSGDAEQEEAPEMGAKKSPGPTGI